MAENSTRILITAEDRASAALGKVRDTLGTLGSASAGVTALMGGLTAALSVGTIVSFAKGTIDAADNMNDLSQRVGVGIKDLAGWKLAADQSGTSIEAVATGIKGLSKYLVENGEKLQAAGITATDANGAMVQLADLFAAMPDGVEKTALAVQLFGKAGMDMIPMLNMGSDGLAKAQKQAEEYATRLEALAPQADQFNDLMAEFNLQAQALGMNVTSYVIGPLTQLAAVMNDLARGGEKTLETLRQLGQQSPLIAAMVRWHDAMNQSRGYGGPKDALGLPALPGPDAPAAARDEKALARARSLLDKSGGGSASSAGSKKASRPFDPEADLEFAILDAQYKASKRAADESVRQAELEEKQHEDAMRRFQERIQARELEEYYATAGEETMREVMERQNAALAKQKGLAQDLGFTFSSAFEDAIIGGKKFGEVLNSLGQDILRIMARKTITEPLANAIGSIDFGSLFANADGGVYSGPGISAYSGQVVSQPTVFPFARGIGLMGEAGPEAILPLRRGPGGKLGVEASGGNVVVNVIEAPGQGGQVRQQDAGGKTIIDIMVDRVKGAVAADIGLGGIVAGQMESTYGLNRAAGAWR